MRSYEVNNYEQKVDRRTVTEVCQFCLANKILKTTEK